MEAAERYHQLARRYKWVTWLGIVLNSLFIFPLLIAPKWFLALFGLAVDPLLWGRIAAILLLWITVFYIPASIDLRKYRVFAWLAIFPSRTGGATFFFGAVLIFGYPLGYLSIAVVDLFILVLQLIVLVKVRKVERAALNVTGKPVPRSRWRVVLAVVAVVIVLVAVVGWYKLLRVEKQEFASVEAYFKYGSIGTEDDMGMPYWIWLVLPRVFPEYLPGPGGYSSLGLYTEPGQDRPVGFSVKTIGFPRVGINCAVCHSGAVRLAPDADPMWIAGAGNHTFDVLSYERFLFACASDPRFNADTLLAEIGRMYRLPWLDRQLYRYLVIPLTRRALLETKAQFAWTDTRPPWGPGRIDPFNPVKVLVLNVGVGDTIGNSDMMPIWDLRSRGDGAYHLDGLNTDLTEVVRSSAIGDGATPKSIPIADLERLQNWLLDLKPPPYPAERFPIDRTLAAEGQRVFQRECSRCHGPSPSRRGQVIPVAEVGTDPHRAEMWTPEAAAAYNAYAKGYDWAFKSFRSTGGYLAVPLHGIWARGPYLHNGSVPSLRDMLRPPGERPKVFYRGYDVFDPVNVGFVSRGEEAERVGTRYDTAEPGNGNQGHLFGTDLPPPAKTALLEYLKTL